MAAMFVALYTTAPYYQHHSMEEQSTQQNAIEQQGALLPEVSFPPPVITKHHITVNGKKIAYTATAGYMKLESDHGKHTANIFYVAYTKDGGDERTRPLTFAFNGGPGSSSVWLHLGALGPRRVVLDDIGNPLPAPYQVVPNDYTWLQWTDLVFVDPVGTGYSRATKDGKREEFHGVQEDAESVAEFIRRYTTEQFRWLSPKFLAGESYGTTRVAALSQLLQTKYGMNISGALLISVVLSFQTIAHEHSSGNDLPYICFLPTLAATSWYHKRLKPAYQRNLDKLLHDVREFAGGDYTLALMQGHALSSAKQRAIANRLAEFTGLSVEFIEACNLRIHPMRYNKELMRRERKVVGRLDSRFCGYDTDAAGEMPQNDPSYSNILAPYTSAVNDYLRRELGFESSMTYEVLTPKVHPWRWGDADRGYVNVAPDLATAMRQNEYLQVFCANGYFDAATPFYATEYTMQHLEVERDMLRRITMTYYEAGHMMYIHIPSLVQFTADVEKFYRGVLRVTAGKGK